MATVDLGDVTLDYAVSGEGPLVVFVCGCGQPAMGWQLQIAPAVEAAGFTTLVYDNRGMPPSSMTAAPYTVAQLADDCLRLVDHIGFERFAVVGHSLGGWVAEELALTRPGRVTRAVLMGSLNRGTAWERAITTVERDLALSDVPLPELFPAVETLRYLPNAQLQDDDVVEGWLSMLAADEPWPNPGRLGQYEACLAWTLDVDRTKRWPSMTVPSLVVAFEHDIDSPPARAREAISEMPGATYVEIPDASHLGIFTHGQQCIDVIVPFLTSS